VQAWQRRVEAERCCDGFHFRCCICKDEERERERERESEREREKEEERHHRLYAASDQQLKITLLVLCQINQGDQPPSVQSANKIKLWIPQRNIKNWCD